MTNPTTQPTINYMSPLAPPTPAPGGKLPDCSGLRLLRDSGWTYEDIMGEYGVSNQSVHRKMKLCGLIETPHIDYSDLIPFRVKAEHRNLNINVLLRHAAREKLGVGRPLIEAKKRELANWLARLERDHAVVGYGPHINDRGERAFGFYYAERRDGIDEWIVRKPKVEAE